MISAEQIQAALQEQISSGKLKLPGLPDIAAKVRQAVQNERYNAQDIAKLIQTDIPLTARIIQVANSPLYRGQTSVEHCREAVMRLGLDVTRNLATSFALRRLFNDRSPELRAATVDIWKHSIKVASIAYTLARISPSMDPDTAMLGGLLHDLGVLPVLRYLHHNKVDLTDPVVPGLLDELRVPIGEAILNEWQFEDDFIDMIRHAENWFRKNPGLADYSDAVVIAQLYAGLGKYRLGRLPTIKSVPAFGKFPIFALGPDSSVELLREAKEEMMELMRLLS
ncbi:MAG: HDOD domain-containing protein [Gammaproteobacteria bacterium]|nr:HDOD domain-containing protein [Gammaproteobacteria bacterium]MDH5693238.1 HDOD domain-containing protein [Gammaproteobacteria bacterium]